MHKWNVGLAPFPQDTNLSSPSVGILAFDLQCFFFFFLSILLRNVISLAFSYF